MENITRNITHLVIHCSATKEGQHVTREQIESWHKDRGFKTIGYHYVIELDGKIVSGRPLGQIGAHVAGHNATTIGICYVGGLDAKGKGKDTRTEEQRASMFYLLQQLKEKFPKAGICGHRDFSPDLNGSGIIEPHEWMKECPCFDAAVEYANL